MCKIQVKTRGRNTIPLADEAFEILKQWRGRHNIFVFGLLPDDFDLKDEERLRTRRNSITSTINKRLENISKKEAYLKRLAKAKIILPSDNFLVAESIGEGYEVPWINKY